jgi:hypothetical protein
MGNAELKEELKMLNKQLKQMIDLKKQTNLIIGGLSLEFVRVIFSVSS